jgi:cytochrome bd-type quinol oxidase subunit 1
MIMKLVIVLFILAILFCLGSAMYYLLYDRRDPTKMVKMLSLRIALSVILFFALILGFATGVLKPNNIALYQPNSAAETAH